MKEQVTRFEKFIQENDAKRKRAEKKAQDERAKGSNGTSGELKPQVRG